MSRPFKIVGLDLDLPFRDLYTFKSLMISRAMLRATDPGDKTEAMQPSRCQLYTNITVGMVFTFLQFKLYFLVLKFILLGQSPQPEQQKCPLNLFMTIFSSVDLTRDEIRGDVLLLGGTRCLTWLSIFVFCSLTGVISGRYFIEL